MVIFLQEDEILEDTQMGEIIAKNDFGSDLYWGLLACYFQNSIEEEDGYSGVELLIYFKIFMRSFKNPKLSQSIEDSCQCPKNLTLLNGMKLKDLLTCKAKLKTYCSFEGLTATPLPKMFTRLCWQ